ncbi:TIGR04283 family arsenosugar biosynthesis glycosyltransferase [Aequorivita echinoideorum]|uniref:TIGR04283 family arsenosugar biosynthesis glycosyltransferase n=1 Tax=Aequorivita echinoideorum TaxID=1549647 RepID=A0ABS5S2L4_9FLAO|nr:TIGR04283 family arsenosugar biosynthesis glycosyltransferase [Aequorivita echinoideorum]MBT0607447.1 TIGR04283 family arsenosugar biosynthesis glycosyltransferase [Aequorivita echinoideorum]
MTLSIIIPVLNEAKNIQRLLLHLSENISGENKVELILVDGGSTDGTQNAIQNFSKNSSKNSLHALEIKLLHSEKGRARQMNTGSRNASGEILYFLHADSFPPKDFDRYIFSEIEKGNPAGCFRMKFDSKHWWLQLMGWFTKFNWRACRGGDQSQFITKNLFDEIGGYDESYVIYEDNILINELYARKKYVVIQQTLTTSARLYKQKGVWNLQFHFLMIYLKRWMGADADELYSYYLKNIKCSKNPKEQICEKSINVFSEK